jgi:hypothetical protein
MTAIDDAYAEGRITAADRSLRVANVESAATLAELDLVVRDLRLDPGEVAPRMVPPPPAQPAPPPPALPPPPPPQPKARGIERDSVRGFRVTSQKGPNTGFKIGALTLVGVIVLISIGASLFVANLDVGDSVDVTTDPFPFPEDPLSPGELPTGEITDGPVDRLALTEAGLRWFVGRYEDQFGTSRVLRLTLWADRASIDRPVHSGRRHEMWSYRDGAFEQYGSITTNSPGTAVVDLRQLRLKALVANIARAKRTLNVEKPETVYVIVANDSLGDGPEAHIYVTNEYNESGYLATTFGGKVVRSYPFQR